MLPEVKATELNETPANDHEDKKEQKHDIGREAKGETADE
jgi:hypothetical protein